MEEATVGIVSGDGEFVDALVKSWRRMCDVPRFTVAAPETGEAPAGHGVIVTDSLRALSQLPAGVVLAILVLDEGPAAAADDVACEPAPARVLRIPRRTGWADEAATLARETVLRLESQAQLAEMADGKAQMIADGNKVLAGLVHEVDILLGSGGVLLVGGELIGGVETTAAGGALAGHRD